MGQDEQSTLLLLIPLLPLMGAALNLAVGKRLGKGFSGAIAVLAVASSMLLAWNAAFTLWESGTSLTASFFDKDWFFASEINPVYALHIRAGLLLDRLSGLMILVITTVGTLIHIYSMSYMEEDADYSRYFAYLNLFTGSMLVLVLGDSLPVTFVGWEGVGLCSYLLIGFWYTKEQNASAGRKAFIVNRIGDFGFLLGMFLIFSVANTLNYDELNSTGVEKLKQQWLFGQATYATFAALLLFIGCTGKSAQLPLYVWLPDAMAGPTPVSALIHAATMVTAGVYLIARLHTLFEVDVFVRAVIVIVGALTALFAASIAVTQRPIKKILAYSTISQLGFMFVAVGSKAYNAGLFHLVTHAFFKAGLFLGAGAIMHALGGEEDIYKMGGLRKKLPITHATFLVYCLAIAGIFPFAGFFSKDAILAAAFEFHAAAPGWPKWLQLGPILYGALVVAAMLTAFYMFRCYFLVFHGSFRGEQKVYDHAHEAPSAMSMPLVVLAVGAALLGFLGVPAILGDVVHLPSFVDSWLVGWKGEEAGTLSHGVELSLMGGALCVAIFGILAARSRYAAGPPAESTQPGALAKLLANKYYVDEIYDAAIVRPLKGLAWFCWKVIDSFLIDLVLVRGSATVIDVAGRTLRYLQNGDAQRYVVGVIAGTAFIIITANHFTSCSGSNFTIAVNGSDVTVTAQPMTKGPSPANLNDCSSGPCAAGFHCTVDKRCWPEGDEPSHYTFNFGDGTGEIPQVSPQARHHYGKSGEFKIEVTAHDAMWRQQDKRSHKVVIK